MLQNSVDPDPPLVITSCPHLVAHLPGLLRQGVVLLLVPLDVLLVA